MPGARGREGSGYGCLPRVRVAPLRQAAGRPASRQPPARAGGSCCETYVRRDGARAGGRVGQTARKRQLRLRGRSWPADGSTSRTRVATAARAVSHRGNPWSVRSKPIRMADAGGLAGVPGVRAAAVRYQSTVRRRPSSNVDHRRVAEDLLRLADVGLRVADVAGALGQILGLHRAADDRPQRREQLVQRDAAAGGDVDHLAAGAVGRAGAQHAVDDVGDVGEVARLVAVAVDLRALAGEQVRDEERDDARVRRRRDPAAGRRR